MTVHLCLISQAIRGCRFFVLKKVLIIDNRHYHAKKLPDFSFYIYVCINILLKNTWLCVGACVCVQYMWGTLLCGMFCNLLFVPTEPPIELFTSTKLWRFILFNYRVFYTINKPQCIYALTGWWISRPLLIFSRFFYKHLATSILSHASPYAGACFLYERC